MEYFIVEAKGISPEIKDWYRILNPRIVSEGRYSELPEYLKYTVDPGEDIFYTDIISFPYFMITLEAQRLINVYEPKMEFCDIFLFDLKNRRNKVYMLPYLERIDCFHEDTLYNKGKSKIIKPVIDSNRTGDKHFFRAVGQSQTQAVMSIELVESLLRRNIRGLGLVEVEIKE